MNSLCDRGIFELFDPELTDAAQRRRTVAVILLLMIGWLFVVAYIGPYVGSAMATRVLAIIPRVAILAGTGVLITSILLISWRRDRPLGWLALMVLAYIGGTALSGAGYTLVAEWGLTGWTRFAAQRAVYGLMVTGPLALVLLLGKRTFGPVARLVGQGWNVRSKLFSRNGEINSWRAWLGGLAIVAGIPFFILMQVASEFALLSLPWWWVGAAVVMSLVNATAEEFIFRWGIQPAVVAAAGVARGLWLQGLFFGLHHLGLSVSVLATLPGAILVGVGSVVFGKSVVETRGLAWAIAAHMVFDIGIFCAFGARF